MSDEPDITCSVTVQPALRALYRERRAADIGRAATTPDTRGLENADPAAPQPVPQPRSPAAPAHQKAAAPALRGSAALACRLARTGQRPLVFQGRLAFSRTTRTTPDQASWFELSVYARKSGYAVQITRREGEETAASRAALVDTGEDLVRFLDAYDPAAHMAAPRALYDPLEDPQTLIEAAQDYAQACAAARAEYRTLVAKALAGHRPT